DLSLGISIKAFGENLCGVSFTGEIQGTTPWRLEGTASVSILFWSVDFDLGPVEWGNDDQTRPAAISLIAQVGKALSAKEVWKPLLPAGGDQLVRLRTDDMPLLVHPLGRLEVKQGSVPLETPIDRIGKSPVDAHRVNLASPKVNQADAAAVSPLT